METSEKVTTRSRVSIYRTNDPMETIAAIGLKHGQDDRHTHLWKKKTKKKQKKKKTKKKQKKNTLSSDCTC